MFCKFRPAPEAVHSRYNELCVRERALPAASEFADLIDLTDDPFADCRILQPGERFEPFRRPALSVIRLARFDEILRQLLVLQQTGAERGRKYLLRFRIHTTL